MEFLNYTNTNIDMECCPLLWWDEWIKMYPILGETAQQNNCVPCVIGERGLTLEDQTKFFAKRSALSTEFERKMLWLHYEQHFDDKTLKHCTCK